jgi:gluconokinase
VIPATSLPLVMVVMGVSGSGKTTIGRLLAQRLAYSFGDADDFHPPSNIRKMTKGEPLTDADRQPWLSGIAAWIDKTLASGAHAVVSCSALKRVYRDQLIGRRASVRLVYLKGDKALIAQRLAARHAHFMPASLLQSQFDSLEEPRADEKPVIVSIDATPEEIVNTIVRKISQSQAN